MSEAFSVPETLERIAAANSRLNAFITIMSRQALEQDRILRSELARGHRRPLHGMTISIKDLIDVEGVPTTAASRVREGHVAHTDAPIVARLREAGAVMVGKCNLHEFALGATSDESAFGAAHNPFDLNRSPGGSSGGSAAAVSACLGSASIGTDTGGSIRIPAAACGVVGLKPACGEISLIGVVPLSASLDHVGPIARTVEDAWHLYDVLKGDALSPPLAAPVKGMTLGKLGGYFSEKLDDQVRQRFDEALDRLRKAGAIVVDLTIAGTADIASTYANVVLPEAYAFHHRTLQNSANLYSEGVADRLRAGATISTADYVAAQRRRAQLRREVDVALGKCDALVLPTLPIPAPRLGASTVRIGPADEPLRPMMLRLTQLFNLTGHPAISLPCGDTSEGLPCGFQLVGRHRQTPALLSLALGGEPLITPHPPRCAGGF